MKEVVIVGAGGFGKEVAFLINLLKDYKLVGFVDDSIDVLPESICNRAILGGLGYLESYEEKIYVAIAVASPTLKESIYLKLLKNSNLIFPNIISDSSLVGFNIAMGIGNILMPYTTLTADINIGNFNMINMHSTIGHDVNLGDFNSIFPNVNISGNNHIGKNNQIGVGTKTIPNITIGNETIIGAGSTVIRDIRNKTKNVGTPTRVIESWD